MMNIQTREDKKFKITMAILIVILVVSLAVFVRSAIKAATLYEAAHMECADKCAPFDYELKTAGCYCDQTKKVAE
jgi:uncharacterized protein YpmB